MKLFILTNALVLAALSPSWLPLLNAPDDAVRAFTTPPHVSVETLPAPPVETASADGVM